MYVSAGLALLFAVTVPRLFHNRAISAPMIVLVAGALLGLLFDNVEAVTPGWHPAVAEYLSEVCVIVALMGVGLAIDRPLGWRSWKSTRRLLLVAMPLGIVAVAVLGWWAAALTPAAAVLLGAALAPTDPVLASDVQVEGPTSGEGSHREDDEVRFALTSEAGLNDALAFPFVYLALFLFTKGPIEDWIVSWVLWELLGKIVLGAVVGALAGHLVGRAVFHFPVAHVRLADRGEPIVALAATFAVYGIAELVGGYGFLAVFVCAVAMRRIERAHEYHAEMHSLVEQLEHVLTLAVLLLLGAGLTTGLLAELSWGSVLVGAALVLVIRPVVGWLSLLGCDEMDVRERRVTAFFGVRGIGSVYYLAYAAAELDIAQEQELWAAVAFTVVFSVLVHGVSATRVMRMLDDARAQGPP
ncbi:cation transporter [Rhodococcus ruber Chol-4]|uniref:cation:proton antiporter n=1 Tax=Rhodococcus sp. TaxID=1831 RepID=UPI000477070F|nr:MULTISPECIES: cation:proton antiporter [Rhodococcus]MDO2379772.1 cation:proton antiporter [Rhodococcus ruber]RIK12825.1 MAG: cation transporter [Acidobacteriota bacterium]ATQ27449.1 cation transporter [Rhodococcus ruber]AUM15579.1 cation transporter [Rhodococcus ruber]AWG98819.1 cation transporter [Rhodococcus ruber]